MNTEISVRRIITGVVYGCILLTTVAVYLMRGFTLL